ncbi:MAG: hypothetical protein OHK0032_14250 [Thermodesulfovibrionales bacterium]
MSKVVFIWFLLISILSACNGSEKVQLSKGIEKEEGRSREVQNTDTELSQKAISMPEIVSVKLTPPSPKVNDTIKAEVLTKGNASVTYQWSLNGKQLELSGDILSPGEFKRGDKISLMVTPFTENRKGNPVTVFTYIFNSSPKIVSDIKHSTYKDSRFVYQVHATDPDGDPLTYSLKSAPPGATIDSNGLIKWHIPPDFKGKAPVTVSVTDGHGGEALYNFEVTIGLETK